MAQKRPPTSAEVHHTSLFLRIRQGHSQEDYEQRQAHSRERLQGRCCCQNDRLCGAGHLHLRRSHVYAFFIVVDV